jgi:phenylpropionate dioxygenase-like ring-hydroxylating dioxygenase large terminal subunit
MRALIPAQAYFDADVFAAELDSLFADTWQFVAFGRDLAQPNDFVTAAVGGRSVVVQNFAGELRAFANVCSHRFARIHACAKGNGPLRCPYHGWIYNQDGAPYSIPSRPKFDDLSPDVLASLALRPYDVDRCGEFVFARRAGDGVGLRQWLGRAGDVLERVSAALGPEVDVNELVIDANWKVTVENTLESYHVGFVHADSFKKVGAKGMDFAFDGPHSSWLSPVDAAIEAQMRKLVPRFEPRPLAVDGYFHQLVFPNLTVATTYGTSFAVQLFEPVSPGKTRFRSVVFQARPGEGTKVNADMMAMLNESVADFNRTVFAEDKAICEQVQLGVVETDQPGMLSYEEERVLRFQEQYVRLVADAVPRRAVPAAWAGGGAVLAA